MAKDWVCDSCGYSNLDEKATFCSNCSSRRHFIKLNYKKLKVSAGSLLYTTSTSADNAAAISDSIDTFKELERLGYDVEPYNAFRSLLEKAWEQQRNLEKTLQEMGKQGDEAFRNYGKEMARQARAYKIIRKMWEANFQFMDRRKAELFKLDGPAPLFLDRLSKAPVGEGDFTDKIASLASLFQDKLDPLRSLVPKYDSDWKSITLVEEMLKIEKAQFDPEMIKIWRKIVELRNSIPIHADPATTSTLEFFGVTSYPPDYQLLWDDILVKFLYSLERFVEVLSGLPKK